jgi:benzil reductase ((S)-benzoin forming)
VKHYIITGASSGIGAALAIQLLSDNSVLHVVSRRNNEALGEICLERGYPLYSYRYDLSDLPGLDSLWEAISGRILRHAVEEMTLINNAGVIDPVGPVETAETRDIIRNVNVNLLAPLLLTKHFSRMAANLNVKGLIVNISSGAAVTPYYGWSSYCTSKAGLEMFTRCAALESGSSDGNIKVIAVAPGIVDTAMQERIRSLDETLFPMKKKFVHYKDSGHLLSPEAAASKLVELINRPSLGNGLIADLRSLPE